MNQVVMIGLDIAKAVFQLHGVEGLGDGLVWRAPAFDERRVGSASRDE